MPSAIMNSVVAFFYSFHMCKHTLIMLIFSNVSKLQGLCFSGVAI